MFYQIKPQKRWFPQKQTKLNIYQQLSKSSIKKIGWEWSSAPIACDRMCLKSPAKFLRSVKRISSFLDKKSASPKQNVFPKATTCFCLFMSSARYTFYLQLHFSPYLSQSLVVSHQIKGYPLFPLYNLRTSPSILLNFPNHHLNLCSLQKTSYNVSTKLMMTEN